MLIFLNSKYYQNQTWSNIVCCITNISSMFLLNAGDWKLVPGSFIMLLKWKYSKSLPFLIANIYHFYVPLMHLSKNKIKLKKNWNLDVTGY